MHILSQLFQVIDEFLGLIAMEMGNIVCNKSLYLQSDKF